MSKQRKSPSRGSGTQAQANTGRLQEQLADSSHRLVKLFDEVRALQDRRTRIVADADLSRGPSEYELLRKRLEALEPEVDQLAGQIRTELAALRKIQSQSPDFSRSGKIGGQATVDPSKRLEIEILALSKRLLEIADAQQAAVQAWNSNPIPSARPRFEAEMARRHSEFDAILVQKEALLKAKKAL